MAPVIGRSIRLATEAVLKTVELVTLALGVRLSHLPPPTIAASEGLTLVSYASWERDRYPRPHPNQRGHSSVGRTLDFHLRCREFKSRCLLINFRKPSANHVHNLTYFKYLWVRVPPSDYSEVVELVDTSNKTVSC